MSEKANRVLVVEDDSSLQKMLVMNLKAEGYHVVAVDDGVHAMAVNQALHGRQNVVSALITGVLEYGVHGPAENAAHGIDFFRCHFERALELDARRAQAQGSFGAPRDQTCDTIMYQIRHGVWTLEISITGLNLCQVYRTELSLHFCAIE